MARTFLKNTNLFAIVIQELDEAENLLNFTKSWTNSWAAQTK